MKICIYGAGAIGGYLGVQMARAGADVSLVARGAHLAAMRESGLKLLIGDEERVVQPRCTDNPAELGPQDFVIVCLKAHSITGVIEAMQPLLRQPSREASPDVERLSALFVEAGRQAPVLNRIRDEIWLKLWGNVCLNPISALTHATLDVICSDPTTRALSKAIMLETQAIAETFGVQFRVDVERRIEGARKVGAHKTSMLQDLERGRPMEIDPLVTVAQAMGRLTGIPTPALDAVLALVAQRARTAGLYGVVDR